MDLTKSIISLDNDDLIMQVEKDENSVDLIVIKELLQEYKDDLLDENLRDDSDDGEEGLNEEAQELFDNA